MSSTDLNVLHTNGTNTIGGEWQQPIQINVWREDTWYKLQQRLDKPKWLHMLDDDLLHIKIVIHFKQNLPI